MSNRIRSVVGVSRRSRARRGSSAPIAVVTPRALERTRRAALRSRVTRNRHHYFSCVAETRYVLRKVFRNVEDEAKAAGLDPLEHQALLQIYGHGKRALQVKQVAARLDVTPAFASVLVKSLAERGLVTSSRSTEDQRVAWVLPTTRGIALLYQIDDQVQSHVDYFTKQLSAEQKEMTIAILLFYTGLAVRLS